MAPSANVGLIATPTLADDADISPEQQRDAETTVDARPSTASMQASSVTATLALADDADISPEQQRNAETTVDARPSTLADDEDIASPEQQRNAETTADDVTRDDDVV